MMEASAVTPEGRISINDLGIWKDEHIAKLAQIARFIHSQGARAGIQLAHAGRKGSMTAPFGGERLLTPEEGRWETLAPSAIAFSPSYAVPKALDEAEIAGVVRAFADAAKRADAAGFDFVEIHGAHGYLLHEFLSPLANQRTDQYGGSFENRIRLPAGGGGCSASGVAGSSASVCAHLGDGLGRGRLDTGRVSGTGAAAARAWSRPGGCVVGRTWFRTRRFRSGPGFQVPFAARMRKEAGIPTAAVGMITEPQQANDIIANGDRRTWCCWRGRCCAIRTGHCMRRRRWVRRRAGRCSICALRRRDPTARDCG